MVPALYRSRADGAVTIAFRPLSDGKVAAGEKVIAELLTGLDDDTLCSSSLVVQREAARFSGARAEDRRRILSAAAGLGQYDDLIESTRERQRVRERDLELLLAQARPLEARAAEIHGVDAFLVNARQEADHRDRVELVDACERLTAAREAHETAKRAERDVAAAAARVRVLIADVAAIKDDIATLEPKIAKARGLLEMREAVERAAAELAVVRTRIVTLEAEQVAEAEATARVHEAERGLATLERRLADMVAARKAKARELDQQIAEVERQERRLADAQCPVIDQIRADTLAACTFLTDAQRDVKGLRGLELELANVSEATDDELALAAEIEQFDTGTAPDGRASREAITNARAKARELETTAGWAERLAWAERYVADETKALDALRARQTAKATDLAAARRDHDALRTGPSVLTTADALTGAERLVSRIEADALQLAREIARAEGRLEELRAAQAEHDRIVFEAQSVAQDVDALRELVTAWKAVRVQILENSIIPGVERAANQILERFPQYGIRIRLETQRELKTSDKLAETLDIRVDGERAESYEGLSGGERTAVDFATHTAIALVVSQRAATRLSLLFVDEPEGLDAEGRTAFASVLRWIADEFRLRIIVASHQPDVVEHVDRSLIVDRGANGTTIRWAA
jgi:colicin import membrane protein